MREWGGRHGAWLVKMVKVFEIVLDDPPSPRGFLCGSRVAGKVVVEVDEPKSYRLIDIALVGSGKAEWTEESGDGSETHRAKEEYLRESATLWRGEDDSDTLSAGRHEFPFAFSLPDSCPPSWEATQSGSRSGSSSTVAWVRYVLTARISTRGPLKADHATEERVRLYREGVRPEENKSTGAARQEVRGSDGLLCCLTGPVVLTAELPSSQFATGERIPITVEAENGGSRDLRAEVSLFERVRLKATSHVKRAPPRTVVRETSSPLRSGSTSTWTSELPAVPDTAVAMETPGGMIRVSYEVTVCVGLRLGQRLEVCFPVAIFHGTSHSSASGDCGGDEASAGKIVTADQYQPWTT